MGLRGDVSKRLVGLGYRRAGRMHVRPLVGEFSSVVDTGPIHGFANDIVPWIGLRHESVERLRAELQGLPFDEFVGTVGAFDFYILDTEYKVWRDPDAREEVVAVIQRASDILSRFADLERLPDAWGDGGIASPDPYTLVSIYRLLGNNQRVQDWLAYGERRECEQENEVCEQFRRFAQNVRARLADIERPG